MKIRAIIHCAIAPGYEAILNELITSVQQHTEDIWICYVWDNYEKHETKYRQLYLGRLSEYELPTLDALIEDAKHTEYLYLYCHTKGLFSNQHQWRRNMIQLTINTPPLEYFIASNHNMMGAYYYPIDHYKHFGGNFFWIKSEFAKTLQKPTEIRKIWEQNQPNCCIFTNTCNIDNPRMIAEFFYGQQEGFNPLAISTCYDIVNQANLPL